MPVIYKSPSSSKIVIRTITQADEGYHSQILSKKKKDLWLKEGFWGWARGFVINSRYGLPRDSKMTTTWWW